MCLLIPSKALINTETFDLGERIFVLICFLQDKESQN